MIAPNIFKPRNDWNVIQLSTKKYNSEDYPELESILRDVSIKEKIPIDMLKSLSHVRKVADARHIYFKRAKELTGNTNEKIGSIVNRDHSTVTHGIKNINNIKELKKRYEYYFNKS